MPNSGSIERRVSFKYKNVVPFHMGNGTRPMVQAAAIDIRADYVATNAPPAPQRRRYSSATTSTPAPVKSLEMSSWRVSLPKSREPRFKKNFPRQVTSPDGGLF